MKEQSNPLSAFNVASWKKFVDEVFRTLSETEPLTAKDIKRIMTEKKWGYPHINLINKALGNDLKNNVVKTSKTIWIKLKGER